MNKTILLIEDDPAMVLMYKTAFAMGGLSIEMAKNGREGFDLAKKLHPDVIVSDIMMPDTDGIELVQQLKADNDLKDIPVIMLTNLSANENTEKKLLDLGVSGYMIKTDYEPQEVVALVKQVMGEREQALQQ